MIRSRKRRGGGWRVVSGALLLASAAGHLGDLSLGFDTFSHLAPVWLGLGAGLAATSLIARRWDAGVLAAASIVLSWLLMSAELAEERSAPPTAVPPGSIKVIQLNAQRRNSDIERVVDWVSREAPDVLTISEARHDLRDRLIRRGWRTAGSKGSLMIFTRSRYLYMARPKFAPTTALTFVNATYASASGPMEVVTAHLDWPTRGEYGAQLAALPKVVATRTRDRMILTGDFNTTPWSSAMKTLDTGLGLSRRTRALPTWPAQVAGRPWPWPILPIDHVFAGSGWRTVSVSRGPNVGSDHFPVVVILAPVRGAAAAP